MTKFFPTLALALFAGSLLTGCGKKDEPPKKPKETHQHAAPHGGDLVEIAGGTAHVEFIHDEAAGTMVVHVLDAASKPTNITEPPVMNLKTAAGPRQLTGAAAAPGAGGSSQWTFRDDALKSHPDGATLRIVIGGKTHNPEVPHEHH